MSGPVGALVRGAAAIGDLVTYQDAANLPATYLVGGPAGVVGDYPLVNVETGERIWSDCRQHGWTFAADAAEPISVYTADQAVEDGVLYRVSAELAPRPTYLTAAVVALCTPPAGSLEDFVGRVADVLAVTRLAYSVGDRSDLMRTGLVVRIGGRDVELWAVVDGAGLTIMRPEDY